MPWPLLPWPAGFGGRYRPGVLDALLALGALALVLWAVTTAAPYPLRVLTVAGLYALATIGWQLVFGLGGALSLAQGTFFGLGGYVSALLALHLGLGLELTLPAAILAALLLAALVALPVGRLESHYFALATLGMGQGVLLLVLSLPGLTGGANGRAGVPGVILWGWAIPRGLALAALVWALVAVGAVIATRLARGLYGRALLTVRDLPLVAPTLGLDAAHLRAGSFLIAAAYGGAAGALSVHTQRVVSPEALEFPLMVTILTMAIVGGRGRVAGAIVGALVLAALPEWLRGLEQARWLVYGALLLATIIIAPEGLIGTAERWLGGRRVVGGDDGGCQPPPRPSPASGGGRKGTAGAVSVPPPLAGEDRGGPSHRRVIPPPPLIATRLQKSFGGVAAVAGVSLTLVPGTITGLVGANGSGKSTLVNLLSGLERPESGTLRLGQRDLSGQPAHLLARAGIARTFQSGALPEEDTVLEAVVAALCDGSAPSLGAAEDRAWAQLAQLELADQAARPCRTLAPGTRRRVELARALVRRPAVLLLDEPAAGLAADERRQLAQTLQSQADQGMALLVVEHDLRFLLALAQRLIRLQEGRISFDGPIAAALADPELRRFAGLDHEEAGA